MKNYFITHGLTEVKTIDNRIQSKSNDILEYVSRPANMMDPLEKKGGSEKFVGEVMQSIKDLEQRKIDIRVAITKANSENTITIHGVTRTIAEWLIWRSHVVDSQQHRSRSILKKINKMRNITSDIKTEDNKSLQTTVCIDEKGLLEGLDLNEEILGVLDAELSIANARIELELP